MKVILFCVAAIAAGAPVAPTQAIAGSHGDHSAGGNLVQNGDTAAWDAKHVSTAGVGNNGSDQDHTMHTDVITSPVAPSHLADSRSNATVVQQLSNHTRHPTLVAGNDTTECTSIECEHASRTYEGVATSSIVVKHVCQNNSTAAGDAITGSWGAQFSSANDNSGCDQERNCQTGHICGMTTKGGTLLTPVCECHAWDNLDTTVYDYTQAGNVNTGSGQSALNPVAATTGNAASFTSDINSGTAGIKVDNVTLPSSANWPQ